MSDEDVPPPPQPLETNGKPHNTKVGDLVLVQNFLAGLIRDAEDRMLNALHDYEDQHRKVHSDHDKWVKPYADFVDRERQKGEDWDARLRPLMRIANFIYRNWKTLAPIVIAILIALGIIRGDVTLGGSHP